MNGLIGVVLALVWGSLVLLAMAGVGQLAARMILQEDPPWGVSVGWGFASTAVIGGLANRVGIISYDLVTGYVIAGAVCFALAATRPAMRERWALFRKDLRDDRLLAILVSVCIVMTALRFVGTIRVNSFALSREDRGVPFNIHDDFHAYMVFPNKMLQAGSLGVDPFSERRMLASLGGSYTWNALLLAQLPEDNLHMVEGGLGLIAFLLAAADLCTLLALSPRRQAAILLVLLMVLHVNLNLTSYMIPAAMFLVLAWHFLRKPREALWRTALAMAVPLAGIASAKTTLLPPAGLMLFVFCGFPRRWADARKMAIVFLMVIALVLAMLAPWMISMYRSFGTPLYPFLGTGGFERIAGAAQNESWFNLLKLVLMPAAFLVFWLLQRRNQEHAGLSPAVVSLTVAWICVALLLGWAAGMADAARYSFPFAFAGMALALMAMSKVASRATSTVILALVAAWHVPQAITLYGELMPRDLQALYRGVPLYTPVDVKGARALQASVPAGAPIFARLAYPLIMDFKRNPIYIIDWPGGYFVTSPRDEALLQGPETLRDYLVSHGFRYVAYSYQSEASFPRKHFEGRLNDPNPLVSHSTRATLKFQANLDELRHRYRNLFDDRRNVMIDLTAPAASTEAVK